MSSVRAARVQNAAFLALALAFLGFFLFPGRFDGDAIGAYEQAQHFYFTDATSIWTSVLIGALSDIAPGPAPMFLLQLVLWIGGLLVLTDALIAAGYPATGQAISLLALSPLLSFDFLDVQKDAFLSGLLVLLIGLAARRLLLGTRFTLMGAAGTAFVFLFALDCRHNALFALAPVWFLFWPVRTLRLKPIATRAAAGLAIFAAALLALDGFNHGPFRVDRAHFGYALIVYDLSGISVRTHADASEGRLANFTAEAQRCYSPHEWDGFQAGVCQPTGLAAQKLTMDPRAGRDLLLTWGGEILRHPVAYGAHRLRHFGCLLSLGCQRTHQMMNAGWWPRPWNEPGMRIAAGARLFGQVAKWMWRGPLGAGWLWLVVLAAEAGAAAWTLRRGGWRPVPYLALSVSLAGLAYLLSFAVVGISDQMRYLHPVIFLGVTAAPLAVCSLARGRGRRALEEPRTASPKAAVAA